MHKNVAETLLGAAVIAAAAGFGVFAYTRSNIETISGYVVEANFTRVDGLVLGSDVKIGGIKIGSVITQELNPTTYQAVVRMSIDPKYALPVDSSAAVISDGLLGGKYLSVEPGGAEEMIEPNGRIQYTQSSVNIEELLGRFMFSTKEP
ncbi:MAG: outer membrane lipid asymmetry maintenance protein MlaD [Proteobacteria bacterium]|nr:outer membrane lipid asymmetry maintenance protein MlaD [Pseudomonadota bacterium]